MSTEVDVGIVEKALSDLTITTREEGLEQSLVSGWVLIVERMDTDGDHWLTFLTSDKLPRWRRNGMLHEMLQPILEEDD